MTVGSLLAGSLLPHAASALAPDERFHDYAKTTWSLEQGLPQITVSAIAQDSDGYIWLGTQAGLARFDGIEFRSYSPANTPEIPGEQIQTLLLAKDGTLWIGTYKGLARYTGHRFFRVRPTSQSRNVGDLNIQGLLDMRDGRMLVATTTGVFVATPQGIVGYNPLHNTPAFALLRWNHSIWIGSVGRLYNMDGTRLSVIPAPENRTPTVIKELCVDQGVLWVGTNHGLYRYVAGKWLRARNDPPALHAFINSLYADSNHNVWVGTTDGLARLRGTTMTEFVPNSDPAAFQGVESIFEDREYNLWLGSHSQGLARLWNGYVRYLSTWDGLPNGIIWSVTPAHTGGLWVGSNDGMYRFRDGRFTLAVTGSSLPQPNAYTLLDDSGRIWIGTRAGLAIYAHGKLVTPPVFHALTGTQVNGVVKSRDGSYWIATLDGLFRYTAKGGLRRYGPADGLANTYCRILYQTRDGQLLVGTESGLYRLNGNRLELLAHGKDTPDHADITAITELKDGELVVGGLREDRLYWYDGTRWRMLTTKDGLLANSPFFITADARNWLWIAGIRGVYRLRLNELRAWASGSVRRLNPEALVSERGDWPGSQKAYCCDGAGNAKGFLQNNNLVLPTRGGVAIINTQNIQRETLPPSVDIQSIHYSGTWHAVDAIDRFTLEPGNRDLQFKFAALSYRDPQGVTIQYRLTGYDTGWITLEDNQHRVATYTNLPPGHYHFMVRAANSAGIWSLHPALIQISLQPYFYQTLWFMVLIGILTALLIYAGYRFQISKLHRQRERLESMVHDRTRELEQLTVRLREMSQSDPLTGLQNRRYLAQQLPADLAFFRREIQNPDYANRVMVFAIADIDHFKRVNDTLGHNTGDQLLQEFATRLKRLVRTGDYVVRWGGEEFLIVFRPMPRDQVAHVVSRVQRLMTNDPFVGSSGEPLQVTCSVGYVEHPFCQSRPEWSDWETLVSLADYALYFVKQHGRNNWAGLCATQNLDLQHLNTASQPELDRMIEEGELAIVHGP
ncbi:MAG TPA: diguanylate cyclase [Gammaproteobacteria bacterium]|nr:diguanylate cyclase [Gammaproteobacteria bacterium]